MSPNWLCVDLSRSSPHQKPQIRHPPGDRRGREPDQFPRRSLSAACIAGHRGLQCHAPQADSHRASLAAIGQPPRCPASRVQPRSRQARRQGRQSQFLPRLAISAATGLQAFNPAYLVKMPESILLGLAGDLAAPLINRNAIKANYLNANAQQIQAVYEYERTLLNAYIEVYNQLTNIDNLENTYQLKTQEVTALTQSIDISSILFKSARADYMEVLLTQRDALRSKFELVDTKKQQFTAMVTAYQALGGGWR
ncbi:MAG: TolC family protein [Bacteroidia bacterium]